MRRSSAWVAPISARCNGSAERAALTAPRPPLRDQNHEEQRHDPGELTVAAAFYRRTHDDEDEKERDGDRRDRDEERATGQAVPSPFASRTHVTTMRSWLSVEPKRDRTLLS